MKLDDILFGLVIIGIALWAVVDSYREDVKVKQEIECDFQREDLDTNRTGGNV